MTRRIEIIEDATGDVVRSIETELTGSNYETMLLGLYRKVDIDRYSIREVDQ